MDGNKKDLMELLTNLINQINQLSFQMNEQDKKLDKVINMVEKLIENNKG